jgi:Protein of unknown function (DUF554)
VAALDRVGYTGVVGLEAWPPATRSRPSSGSAPPSLSRHRRLDQHEQRGRRSSATSGPEVTLPLAASAGRPGPLSGRTVRLWVGSWRGRRPGAGDDPGRGRRHDAVGGLPVIAIGLRLLGLGRIRVANLLPAVLLAPLAAGLLAAIQRA